MAATKTTARSESPVDPTSAPIWKNPAFFVLLAVVLAAAGYFYWSSRNG